MDKYEFNIKVEQIKKLVNKNDFATAMKIADGIDWRRVRNANLLSMISQVYEKNEEYQEAKEVLLLAFERAPISKRILYKLTELALKEGSLREAEDYYREFCDLAPDDTRQHLLQYMILEANGATLDQLIRSLERYTATELEEKWMYELAKLYGKAGRSNDCIQLCDKLILMYGDGAYVEQAGQLKERFAPASAFGYTARGNAYGNYGRQPGYVQGAQLYGQQSGAYGQPAAYGQDEYAQQPVYEPGEYAQPSPYASGEYAQQPVYAQGEYTQPSPYASGEYAQQPGYEPGEYAQPSPYASGEYVQQPGYAPGEYVQPSSYASGEYAQPSSYASGENVRQPGYGPDENVRQPVYAADEYAQPPSYTSGGYAQPSFYASGEYDQPSFYASGGHVRQPGYAPDEYATPSSYASGENVRQPVYGSGEYATPLSYAPGEDVRQPGYAPGEYGTPSSYAPSENIQPSGYSAGDYGQSAGKYMREADGYVQPEGSYMPDAGFYEQQANSYMAAGQSGFSPDAGYPSGGEGYGFQGNGDRFQAEDYGAPENGYPAGGGGYDGYGYSSIRPFAQKSPRTWGAGLPSSGTEEVDEELVANLHQAVAEKELAAEMSRISTEADIGPEPQLSHTKIFKEKNTFRSVDYMREGGMEIDRGETKRYHDRVYTPHHFIIKSELPQEGFETAVEVLKAIHQENGVNNQVIKISGSKLSRKGVFHVSDKLAGKDLIVEEAGDLSQRDLDELQVLLERDETGMIVVLIDQPGRLEELHQQNPGFINLFRCINMEEDEAEPKTEEGQAADWRKPQPKPEEDGMESALKEPEEQEAESEAEEELEEEMARHEFPSEDEEEDVDVEGDEEPEGIEGIEGEEPDPEETEEEEPNPEETEEEEFDPEETEEEELDPEETEGEGFDSEETEEEEPDLEETEEEESDPEETEEEDTGDEDMKEEPEESEEEAGEPGETVYEKLDPADDVELDLNEFADYAVQYAKEIDCNITGKSMLALYERIEILEEDGIPLTRAKAEELIEEAADRAEKPSLSGMIKGVFSPKYDKEGMLILKEEHFI